MMIALTLTRSLQEAEKTCNADLVARCYRGLQESFSRATTTTQTDLENLILCSEVALKCGRVDIADECCLQYERSARHYSLTDGFHELEPCDQLSCRWYFCQALVLSARTRTLKGRDLVEGTLKSVEKVMKGLKVALLSDRYKFLIYNASVHFWHVSRPLQRIGLRSQLVQPFAEMIDALNQVSEHAAWKARLLSAFGLCQYEGGKVEEALASLQTALEKAHEANDAGLHKEITQIRVHIGQVTAKLKPEAVATAPIEDQATQLIQLARSGALGDNREASEKQFSEMLAKLDPPGKHGAKRLDIDYKLVSELGYAAAILGCRQVAVKCAQRAQAAQDLVPRLRSDLTVCLLELQDVKTAEERKGPNDGPPPGPGALSLASEVLTTRAVNFRVQIIKKLEQTINGLLRFEDAPGIHDGAVLAWNTALPLLQPNLRHHVARLFTIAAKALRAIDSPLHRLRTQLHLESAKCSLGMDLVPAAYQDTLAALALDYPARYHDEVARTGFERPLDRYLIPMQRSLALKTNPYAEPDDPEEQAMLYLERAKDAKMTTARQDALQRAIKALKSLPHPVVDYDGPVERRTKAEQRALLWGEIVRVAWQFRLDQLVLDAARYAVAFDFRPRTSKERTMQQAEVLFLQAEACVQALKNKGVAIAAPDPDIVAKLTAEEAWLHTAIAAESGGSGPDELAGKEKAPEKKEKAGKGAAVVAPPPVPVVEAAPHAEPAPMPTTAAELQAIVPLSVLKGMGLGLAVKEPWIVMNGAAYAWNHFRHIANEQLYLPLLPLYRLTMERLMKATVEEPVEAEHAAAPAAPAPGAKAPAKGGGKLAAQSSKAPPKSAAAAAAAAAAAPAAPPSSASAPPTVEKEAQIDPHMLAAIGQTLLSGLETDFLRTKFPEYAGLVYRDLIVKAAAAPIGCGKDSETLKQAADLGRQLLGRLGENMAPPRSFVEVFSRVLSLLGQPLAATGAAATTREKTGQVVAAIGLVGRPDVSRDEKEKALKQALESLAELSAGKSQKDIELWSKLSLSAFSSGFIAEALHCCIEAAELPEGLEPDDIELPEDLPELSPRDWYWMSVAELVGARAVVAMSQSGQDGMSAAKLKRLALTHCGHAAKYGYFCKRRDAVELAARTLWNAALDFLSSPLSRGSIARPLSHICSFFRQVGVGDLELCLKLHVTLCDSMFNARRYADGLLEVQNACSVIPASMHRDLLKWKVVFQSRLGKNVEAEMLRVADYPKETQADVWLALALQSRSRYDQLIARQKAVEVLADRPWKQAEFLIGIGEWLLLKEGEVSYGQEVLKAAADLLLKIDGFNREAEPEELATAVIRQDKSMRRSLEGGSVGTGGTASAGRTSFHGGGEGLSQQAQRNSMTLGKAASRRISSSVVRDSMGGTREDLPSARVTKGSSTARISSMVRGDYGVTLQGAESMAPPLPEDRPSELSVNHMNLLLRIFCLLASSAKQTPERVSYLISAQIMAVRMLNMTADAANRRHAAKKAPADPPIVSLPYALLQYAYFTWPKEATQLLLEQQVENSSGDPKKSDSNMFISKESVPTPELTLQYLIYLIEQLSLFGFHVHAIPLCHVYAAIVDLSMFPPPGSKDIRPINHATSGLLKLATLLDQIGLSEEARMAEVRAGPLMITPDEIAAARSEVEQRQIAQAALQERSYGFKRLTGFSPPPSRKNSESSDNKKDEKDKKKDEKGERGFSGLLLMAARAEAADQQLGLGVRHINPMAYHETWMQRAQFFIERGQFGPAAELLSECIYCCRGFNDDDAATRVRLMQARLALFISDPTQAMAHVKEADKYGGDLEVWGDLIEIKSKALAAARSPSMDTRGQALDFLQNAAEGLQNLYNDMPLLDLQLLIVRVMQLRSDMVIDTIQQALKEGPTQDFTVSYNQVTASMQKQMHILKVCGGGMPYVKSVIKYADALLVGIPLTDVYNSNADVSDHRPRLRQVISLLGEADKELRSLLKDQMAAAGLNKASRAALGETDKAFEGVAARLKLESHRLLIQVLVKLSHVSIQLAALNDANLASDRAQTRPKFPKMPSKVAEPVEAFLDDLDSEEQREESLLTSGAARPTVDVQALAYATQAIELSQDCPDQRAQAIAHEAQGAALLYLHRKEILLQQKHPYPEPGRQASLVMEKSQVTPAAPVAPVAAPAAFVVGGSKKALAGGASKKNLLGMPPGSLTKPPPAASPSALEAFPLESLSPQLSQALRHLETALTDALHARDYQTAQTCAERLVEGNHLISADPKSPYAARAFEMLLLAQSCRAVVTLRELYFRAADRTGLELLLMKQQLVLEQLCARPSDNYYWKHCTETLQGISPLPRVLAIGVHPYGILSAMPSGTIVTCLHLSATTPGKLTSGIFVKGSGSSDALTGDVAIVRTSDTPGLTNLGRMWATLVKTTEISLVNAQSLKRPAGGDAATGQLQSTVSGTLTRTNSAVGILRLGTRERGALADKEETTVIGYHLNPQFQTIKALLDQTLAGATHEWHELIAGSQGHVLLFNDWRLMELPVESARFAEKASSVSRDFSVHVLHSRLLRAQGKPELAPISDSGLAAFSASEISYCVDMRSLDDTDAIPGRRGALLPVAFKEAFQSMGMAHWKGILGDGVTIAGEEEVRQLMMRSKALMYVDVNRLPAHVLPQNLSTVDLSDLRALLVFDRAYNDAVIRRQTAIDVKKFKEDLDCEQPREVAALLTLRGVQCLMIPSSPTLADADMSLAKSMMEAMRKDGVTIGRAMRSKAKLLKTDVEIIRGAFALYGVPFLKLD